MDTHKQLIGDAGEHFAMMQSSLRGFTTDPARRNQETIDFVLHRQGRGLRSVQVKTSRKGASPTRWMLSKKDEKSEPNLFYFFVHCKSGVPQDVSAIVPSRVVSAIITRSHASHLEKGGGDSNIRGIKFSEIPDVYKGKDAWEQLK